MLRFIHNILKSDGSLGYEFKDYPPVRPKPIRLHDAPEPEPHVMSNCVLSHELEAEYLNEHKQYRAAINNSSTARKHFRSSVDWDGKTKEQNRDDYFAELSESVKGIEAREPKLVKREETYEDVILKFGGSFCGQSEVLPRSVRTNGLYADNGMKQ
jgi:hypothetical protein